MRDYDAERDKPKVTRTYWEGDAKITTRGPLKPDNVLLDTLGTVAASLAKAQDYDAMRRLAWELGMNGEHHACEVIMDELNKPRPAHMYGGW